MTPADERAELEALAKAFGGEEWRARGQEVLLVHDGGTVIMAEADPRAEFEDEHAERVAAFIAAANPATILKLIEAARQSDGGWQGIETAPRGGERVMLYAAAWEMTWGEVQVGHFEGDGEGSGEWVTPEGAVGDNDPGFDPEAECPDTDSDDDWNIGPTHWRPLPPAPHQATSTEDGK